MLATTGLSASQFFGRLGDRRSCRDRGLSRWDQTRRSPPDCLGCGRVLALDCVLAALPAATTSVAHAAATVLADLVV